MTVRLGSAILAFVGVLLVAGCGGCGGGRGGPSVRGTVTLDGVPLGEANIEFHPLVSGVVGHGVSDTKGNFEIAGANREDLTPGEYLVTVMKLEMDPVSPEDEPHLVTPLKYATKGKSDLRVTIGSGRNTVPLELKSK
jgi:hypothetical protein